MPRDLKLCIIKLFRKSWRIERTSSSRTTFGCLKSLSVPISLFICTHINDRRSMSNPKTLFNLPKGPLLGAPEEKNEKKVLSSRGSDT